MNKFINPAASRLQSDCKRGIFSGALYWQMRCCGRREVRPPGGFMSVRVSFRFRKHR